jgi:hypothetical protein
MNLRLQTKVINITVNILLEYGFYSVPYSKAELEELDRRNKKLAKRMMKISIRCSTFLLFTNGKNREIGIRSLYDLYIEINIVDLLDLLNY